MTTPSALRRFLAPALAGATLLYTAGAHAALPVGTAAPPFQARASLAGQAFDFKLAEALARGPVVVYFYPSAFTGGCNLQARSFAEHIEQFKAAGASVIGVSLDSIERLNAFSADPESCGGKVPVASDADGRIARAYDLKVSARRAGRTDTRGQAIDHDSVERTTFVVARDGRIAALVGGVAPDANVEAALLAVQQLAPPATASATATAPATATATAPAVATPAIEGVVAAGTPIVLVQDGFQGTEGPLGLPDGSLLFTETTAQRITRIAPDDRVSTYLENSNGANGLGLAPGGELVAVQVAQTRVGIIGPQGHGKVLAAGWDGKPFGRPNDLVVARDGSIYFTDSGANRAPGQAAPAADVARPAVYRIDTHGQLQRLADGITRPNGIQLSPDERVLYVADTQGEHVLAFDIGADGRIGTARPFARLQGWRQGDNGWASGADGLAVDAQGRLYVASNAGIEVFDRGGRALGVIALPKQPQNLAFAGPGKRTLYAVGRGSVWRIAALTPGNAARAK
jgi:gluconolactonase